MVEYIAKVGEKYNDLTNDNVWLHRIANETAKTNALLSQLIDLLEDTQNCFDDVWKVDGLSSDQKYPQARMEHMFGVVASKIGKHVQRALSKIDLFHGPFTTVRQHARGGSFVLGGGGVAVFFALSLTRIYLFIFSLQTLSKHFQTLSNFQNTFKTLSKHPTKKQQRCALAFVIPCVCVRNGHKPLVN